MPANLPAIVVLGHNSPGLTSKLEAALNEGPPPVTLVQIDDPKVPGVVLLVPPTNHTFADGMHYLDYTLRCSNGGAPGGSAVFTTGPSVPLPTRIGTVKELADGTAVISPTPELAAFAQTTRFDVFVDGQSLGSTRYRGADRDDFIVRGDAQGAIDIGAGGYVPPSPSVPLCTSGADKTKHDVKLVGHVAGSSADTEPLSFTIEVDCTAPATGSTFLPDGGGDDRGASGGTDGCSAAGGSGALGSLAAFFTTGAAIAVLFRRRRRAAL